MFVGEKESLIIIIFLIFLKCKIVEDAKLTCQALRELKKSQIEVRDFSFIIIKINTIILRKYINPIRQMYPIKGKKTNKDQKLILMEQRLYLINVIKPG